MQDLTMEMENKNLVAGDELVNSDNPEVETVTNYDTELETNSDENEVDTFVNGDIETEIAASDHTEDETVSSDDAEDEPSASDDVEEEIASDYDTELESGNSGAASTEIISSDLTKPDTDNSDITEADITSYVAEVETGNRDLIEAEITSSENAEAEGADEEIATDDGDEVEPSISDNPEIKLVKGGVFVPVYSDERELLGFAEMKYPDCFEDQDAPTDKVPDNLPEEPCSEEKTDSGILEGSKSSLDVSKDKVELLENTELEQALHATDGENSAKVENATSDSIKIQFPEGVVAPPRNEEELHLDIFKDNPEGILTYLPVSDDNGEVLGDTELEQQVKAFCKQYSNLAVEEIKDVSKLIEEAKNLAAKYTLQTNKAENIFSGTTTKYRIRGGILWNITKTLVKTEGYEWVTWFKKNFSGREFRTVQDYMRLAKIPGIIRYAFLGKERLIQVAIYLKEFGAETDDPVGAFFKKYIVFNPEEEIDVQEFKIKTDIAINRQRCIKAGLDEITMDMIESIVRNGKEVESKQVKELQVRKDAGQDIAADFKKIIASDKKLEPFMTPQRQAEWFKNAANRFISAVEDAIKKPEYRSQLDVALINKLKGIVLELEQQVQAKTQQSAGESTETGSLTIN